MPDAPPLIYPPMAQGTAGQLQPSRSHPTASSSRPQKRETTQRQPGPRGGGQGRRKRERPGKASVRGRNRERRRRPGGECAGAPFPGTFTSRCRPRPGAGGVSLHVGGDATADSPSRRGAPIPRACEPAAPESTGPKCRSLSTRTHRSLHLQRPPASESLTHVLKRAPGPPFLLAFAIG